MSAKTKTKIMRIVVEVTAAAMVFSLFARNLPMK
jgi:hypothetical protein